MNSAIRNLAILVLLISAPVVGAQGNMHVGSVEIHPLLAVRSLYDDNIYLTETDEFDDLVITIAPGIEVSWEKVHHAIQLGYTLELIKFADNTDESTIDHEALLKANLSARSGLLLELSDRFEVTSDPATSELTDRENRIRNRGQAGIGVARDRLEVKGRARSVLDDYDSRNELDKVENAYGAAVFYRFFPKTSLFIDYDYGTVTYDREATGDDTHYHQAGIGVRGTWLPKTTGTLKVGYQNRDYDVADSFEGAIAELSAVWQPTATATVTALGGYGVTESTFDVNRYYRYTKASLALEQQVASRLTLLLSASGDVNDYPEAVTTGAQTGKREDTILAGDAGLSWEIQEWLTATARYSATSRNSNFDAFDYGRNQVLLEVAGTF